MSNRTQSATHRQDIDGLRCLAIIPVLFFHLGVSRFPGGFVGVDIFFVISGYLITGIVARDVQQDRFTFARFYERRVRRIAPALLVMLALSTIGAYFALMPADLIHYGHSLVAALLSCSNLYFWTQSDYFKFTYTKILLHTWSLSVEEQFYILLPLTIYLLRRRWSLLRWVLVIAFVVSFGICISLSITQPETAFYMPFSRAWELLFGSLLVLIPIPRIKMRYLNELAALAGFGLIVIAIVLFEKKTIFPGPSAFIPCLGSALLLYTGESGTTIGSILGFRPFAFIGLISYSLYLIHWPLILFSRLGVIPIGSTHSSRGKITLALLSLILGAISWKFVESPFRIGGSQFWTTPRIWKGFCLTSAVLLVAGSTYFISSGFPARYPAKSLELAKYLEHSEPTRIGTCFITSGNLFDKDYRPDVCTAPDKNRPNYAIVGDSHAAALWYAFTQVMPNVNFTQINASGCLAVQGSYDGTNCGQMRRYLYEKYLAETPPDLVILIQEWGEKDVRAIAPTIRWYQAHQIPLMIAGPVQEYDVPLPLLLATAIKNSSPTFPAKHKITESAMLDRELQQIANAYHVPYLSSIQRFCSSTGCQEYADAGMNIPLLTDDNHLTYEAAEILVKSWVQDGKIQTEKLQEGKLKN